MSVGPEGEQGPQPGSWPPPAGNTPQWQQPGPPAPPPGGAWPPPGGPGYPGGPGMPGGPAGPGGPGGPGGPSPWGGAPPGPPQPYGFGQPPQPPKKGNGAIIAAVAGGLALIIVIVIVIAVAGGGGKDGDGHVAEDPVAASGKTASEAGQGLGQSAGLVYTGTYGGGPASFTVTKAGTARGSYSSHGSLVSRVDVDGTSYIKAGTNFWTSEGETSTTAAKANGKWAKAPTSATDLDLAGLSPAKLSQALQQSGNDPGATTTAINGTSTLKISASQITYYITTSKPHRLLRIEGYAGGDQYSLDVKPLDATAMGPVFTQLRGDVQGLTDAYDPGITILPVGKMSFGSCSETGCTIHGTVRPSVLGSSNATVHVKMSVRFWGNGGTVSTCTDTATAKPSQSVKVSCRTSGSKWSSWYRSHNGGFTVHSRPTFDATVNSSGDVNGLLSKLSQEQQTG
jgi:hypothetical protein